LTNFSLTIGPVVGAIRDAFAKVKAIDAKHGKFDLVLAVGDFFGPIQDGKEPSEEIQDLMDGKMEGEYSFHQLKPKYGLK
jgi:hypothetical protein